ncbi:MAG: hypothetical protein GF365_04130 [Candidatus Buchananbacteria bacterium]|nr:hypothetical protein [Candidatus Buchananbacteria bacterium]
MNNYEKPISISRGKEINTEKILKTLQEKLLMLENYHTELGQKIKDKQTLYNREFMKSPEKRDYGLIADLTREIEELDKIADKVLDEMLTAQSLIQEGQQKLRDQQEISDQLKQITELEKILKEKF